MAKTSIGLSNGDLSEALRTVNVDPESIEIVCSKHDAEKIFQAVQDLDPFSIKLPNQTAFKERRN